MIINQWRQKYKCVIYQQKIINQTSAREGQFESQNIIAFIFHPSIQLPAHNGDSTSTYPLNVIGFINRES